MPDTNTSSSWLPGLLVVVGLFFITAGIRSGGPDLIGGIVFGALSLAAAAVIHFRRVREARALKLDNQNAAEDRG